MHHAVRFFSSIVVIGALSGCIKVGSDDPSQNPAGSAGASGSSPAGAGGSGTAGTAGGGQGGSGTAGAAGAGAGGSGAGGSGAGSGGAAGEGSGGAGGSQGGASGSGGAGQGGSSGAGAGGSAGSGGSAQAGAGGSAQAGSGGSPQAGSGGSAQAGSGGSAGSAGGSTLTSCTEAMLFAGNPYFTGDVGNSNPAGQPLLADPPLRSRHLALSGERLFIDTQSEVWLTDGPSLKRAAGNEQEAELQYQPSGPCASARFVILDGIAALPSGNVVVADTRGGGLVELQDPAGTCIAAPIAGNTQKTLDLDIESAGNPGDVDGPGASAKFFGVRLPTADAAGNIYVVDTGNQKIKKVAADAARTVSTLYDFAGPDKHTVLSMTEMKGKLYVAGVTAINDFLWELDTAGPGAPTVVYEKRGIFDEFDSSMLATLLAMTNDGEALIVGSQKGYIFRLSTGGKQLGTLAGNGTNLDFPTLDLSKPVPASTLPLKSYAVGDGSLVRKGNTLVWTGANGTGFHLFNIACQ